MTHNQSAHFNYTINEWNSAKHKEFLDVIFKNEDI